nr:MAG TPA: hypothetical protein [Caudoviricetes sp.]
MNIKSIAQEDIDNFKKLKINQHLIKKFEENKAKLEIIEELKAVKQKFGENKIVDNIEIGKECIEKGLVLTHLDECNFTIPIEVVNMVVEFAKQFEYPHQKDPYRFLTLYPSKYYNLKDEEIPIDEIGVYYNPHFDFTLRKFSIELLEMKNKPKKASVIKQATALLKISRSDITSFKDSFGPLIGIFIIFGVISTIIFLNSESIIPSLILPLIYFIILIDVFYKTIIKPFKNKDKIIEEASSIDFLDYLNNAYSN